MRNTALHALHVKPATMLSMYAQCPECQTFFRVRAAQLRVAGGLVRCSRCQAEFNALLTLHEELPAPAEDTKAAAAVPFRDPHTPGDLFADESLTQTEDLSLGEPAEITEPLHPAGPPPVLAAASRPVGRRWPWILACTVLGLLLAGQAVHANRSWLAAQPLIGPYLQAGYAAIRLPIPPRHNIARWQIVRTEIISHPTLPGVLQLSTQLANRAAFAQPLPLLQVSLEDRWGDLVGRRRFMPSEYAPDTAPPRLAPGATLVATLDLVDPGNAAVGFTVDACLPPALGSRCASEVKAR